MSTPVVEKAREAPFAAFAAEVRTGLGASGQKSLPSSYLYDEVGSALFEVITALPEYGVTRAEERVLAQHGARIAQAFRAAVPGRSGDSAPAPVRVIELGSGTGRKTRLILEALARDGTPLTYCPIDISGSALVQCCQAMANIEGVRVEPFESDYVAGLAAASAARRPGEATLVLFLGSTIGNFPQLAATRFLQSIRASLHVGDALLLGADLLKPVDELLRAYDDPIGVTAAFNLNLLARLNRDLGAGIEIDGFVHEARFNAQARSVEMHLRAVRAQNVVIHAADVNVAFQPGETIWTESSHKYLADEIVHMGQDARFALLGQWVDEVWPFAETLMVARD
ncbi:L-histidine N(alpha)-methyltransferase [Robbsia sp. Bb-Pol-6]|uniref:L-histidine N(Alpha)-methyltransferase n=1 Tax=Robbsia betulipollinis TaxID=2981849 RepID=A0ABT3ZPA3_9BURK|nr:L-histidine N(alpha)-methyltransferase [Robbsia betulipollinis]MCY0387770.1 L-histidine N(alpha)-methyltransferase [Robbsia betulipollinis]